MSNKTAIIRFVSQAFWLIVLYVPAVIAQQVNFSYTTKDLLRNINSVEHWKIKQGATPDVSIIERTAVGPYGTATTEERSMGNSWWRRFSSTSGSNVYYVESLNSPPYFLEHQDSTYGFVEMRDRRTDEVIEAWPTFVSVVAKGKMLQSTTRYHISDNRVMEVVRLYSNGYYFIPILQELKVYKSGVDPVSVPSPTRPERYLDAYVTTRINID